MKRDVKVQIEKKTFTRNFKQKRNRKQQNRKKMKQKSKTNEKGWNSSNRKMKKKKLPGISSKLGVGAKCFNPEVEMAELADVLARDLATTILLEI